MNINFTEADKSFEQTITHLKEEYLQISTGRANPALLDGVNVETYGTFQPIKNIASINLEDSRTLAITPWESSQLKSIEKALHDSNLPFSISVGEKSVRVNIPQLTEESKKSIVKLVKEKLEEARVRIRNQRQETIKEIEAGEKNGDFSQDQMNRYKDDLQKKVDKANDDLEALFDKKEADIMKV